MSRSFSLSLALMLTLTLVPAPAAATDACEPEACRSIALYVLAGGGLSGGGVRLLSALPGDAMPSDPGTRSASIDASTRAMSAISIAKEGAFRVNLTSPMSSPSYVSGLVRVSAIDLAGNSFTLAERAFEHPEDAPFPENIVNSANAAANTTLAIHPGPRIVYDTLHARANATYSSVANLVEASGSARGATAQAYASVCGGAAWNSAQCRQLTGRLGPQGAWDLCAPAPPPGNTLGNLAWTAVRTADGAQRPHSGRSACASTFNDVNSTAQSIDDAAGTDELLPPGFPGRDLLHIENTQPPPPHWKDVTLDAAPPSWLPQTGSTFTLPPGMRLSLSVDLWGMSQTPTGMWVPYPIEIEAGHPSATTALHVRTPTPGAFAALAYDAAPILPGLHTGTFANATDADDFAFTAPAGSTIRVTEAGSFDLRFQLFDQNGGLTTGSNLTVAAAPGTWTLRVASAGTQVSLREYAFRLELVPPGPIDEGGQVPEGLYAGTLAGADIEDTFYLFTWKAQRFTARLEHAADVGFDLARSVNEPGPGIWDTQEEQGSTFHELAGRSTGTGWLALRVSRTYGEGTYTLALDVDESGNLTMVPSFNSTWSPQAPFSYGRMVAYQGGIDVDLTAGHPVPPRIEHLTLTTRSVVVEGHAWPVGRAADGALIVNALHRISYLMPGDEPHPLALGAYVVTLAQDSIVAHRGSRIVWIAPDGSETSLAIPTDIGFATDLVHSPAGDLYLTKTGPPTGPTYRVDFATGFTRAPTALDGLRAFDAEGRAYRVLNRTLVERYDPASGAQVIVAKSTNTEIRALVASGDHLYAMLQSFQGGPSTIGILPATPGFEGFHPPITPRALPDLTITAIEERPVEIVLTDTGPVEERRFSVTVSNVGEGLAAPHFAQFAIHCRCRPEWSLSNTTVPSLAAGEAVTLEILWRSFASGGEYNLTVALDHAPYGPDEIVESNETNNRVSHVRAPFTGPLRAACHEHLGPSGIPVPLFGSFAVACSYGRN